MGKRPIALVVVTLILLMLTAAGPLDTPEKGGPSLGPHGSTGASTGIDLDALLSGVAPVFTENRGQVDNPEVHFYAHGDPLSVAFRRGGIDYYYRSTGDSFIFTMRLLGANSVVPKGGVLEFHRSNYFLGPDPSGWVSGARNYQEVLYQDVYDGVDLRFHFKDGLLKYDLILDPDAERDAIVVEYDGLDRVQVDPGSGDLLLFHGDLVLRDHRPVFLQGGTVIGRGRVGGFRPIDDLSFGFDVPQECHSGRSLTIDPGLVFSTLYGGLSNETFNTITMDHEGNVLLGGYTYSLDFPKTNGTVGPYDPMATFEDMIVVKFDKTLSQILFSTLMGGPKHDWVRDIAVSSEGNIYLVGGADDGMPLTDNALNTTYGGNEDGILIVLNNNASELIFSSYIGGDNTDFLNTIVLQDGDEPLLYGRTNSSDIPTTSGAFCETYVRAHPIEDEYIDSIYVVRLNRELDEIMYCTYLNGFRRRVLESVTGAFTADSDGNVYIAGGTDWEDFPVTDSSFQKDLRGEADGFVVKLDNNLSTLLGSTLLGGSQMDIVKDISVTSDGRVIAVGMTFSSDFPIRGDAFKRTGEMLGSGFISELDNDLSRIEYSSYYGGSGYSHCNGVVISEDHGRLYVQGGSSATDLPVTKGCFAPLYSGGGDFLITVFNLTTYEHEYCTYLGGRNAEQYSLNGMMVEDHGNVLLVGSTDSNDFPLTGSALYSVLRDGRDAFLVVLDPEPLAVPGPPGGVDVEAGDGLVNITWDVPGIEDGQIIGFRILKGRTIPEMRAIKRLDPDFVRFQDKDVVNGERYYYSVSAINSAGEGEPSTPVETIPFGLPSEPWGLNPTTGDGTVRLEWSRPNGTGGLELQGFHVYRGEVGEDLEPIRRVGNVTVLVDDTVVKGRTYSYAVSSFTAAGNSSLSKPVSIRVEGPPDPPTAFSVEGADHRVVLRWRAPANDGGRDLGGYRILRGTRPTELSTLVVVGPSETEHIDEGLENGMTYFYRMMASNVHGDSRQTQILPGIPVGLPLAPRDLRAVPMNRSVSLSWSAPLEDGGSDILHYRVYVGATRTGIALFTELGPVLFYLDTDLTNGVALFYAVSAVNSQGEGDRSAIVEVTPYGKPGPPTDVTLENRATGILVSWKRPSNKGGAETLSYLVLRGTSPDDLSPAGEVVGTNSYLDEGVSPGQRYHYGLHSINPIGEASDLSERVAATAILAPGPVVDLRAKRGDGLVSLTWTPPEEDGGAPVTGYIVFQGTGGTELTERARVGAVPNHSDRFLENGRTYRYYVVAVNQVGPGAPCDIVSARPVPAPGPPMELTARYTGGDVRLTWSGPGSGDTAPVTGYRVYRRTGGGSTELLVELGMVYNFTDSAAERGRTYYYSVAATSDVGEGTWATSDEVSTGIPSNLLWALALSALVFLAALGVLANGRRRTRLASGAGAAIEAGPVGPSNIIEEVYLVYGDGRLIATCAREECKIEDADLTSSMLIAIQGMVQEGLERGGELESIKSGENIIMMERGTHLNLAVVIYGRPDDDLKELLEETVSRIEGTYAGLVEDWTGDRSVFEGVDIILGQLLESTAGLAREDLDSAMARYQVALLSAIDFYRGYVRLKVAALNATPGSVSDASIQVHYDPSMLRLERVEPDTLTLRGDAVELGNVKAGEKRAVSFLFDPLICQETYVDGTLVYRDAQEELVHTSMKRRHATVVCPIFFTREHANTAMLKRLISEELHMVDARVFTYPGTLDPREVLRAGKLAQGGGDVQLVREFVSEAQPYEAEVWYYGETQVKGYKMVMRLRVLEDGRVLEFFAASSAMEPITGLLAEFRRDLLDVFRERFRVEDVREIGREDEARSAIADRELFLHRTESATG